MLQMSKKNGASPPRGPSASAIREAAGASSPAAVASPPERPKRKTYTAEYKQRVLREADAAIASGEPGALGALLRREGLYSSHMNVWRRQRDRGELAGLAPQKRGRKATRSPLADENERLRREVERLKVDLQKAETIIDVQKKLSLLLGLTRPDDDTAEKKR
jgi:transposase